MDEIIKSIQSPVWWFTAVLVAVLVNLLTALLVKYGPLVVRRRWPGWLAFVLSVLLAGLITHGYEAVFGQPQDRGFAVVVYALLATFLRLAVFRSA